MAESAFLELNNRDDLQRLIDDEIQESLTLDYKASGALGRQNNQRNELCKDVSAFANSAGGQIVYGITEEGHLPSGIDGGVDPQEISREWIEQVINSNIQPRIRGLIIKAIPLDDDLTAYALTIPPSTTAHQAPDKRYYRRFNFQSVAMDDYEVRDVMNRSSSAEPFTRLHFKNGHIAGIKSQPDAHVSDPIELYVLLGNRSPQPAHYTVVSLGVSRDLEIMDYGGFEHRGESTTPEGHVLNILHKEIGIPDSFPLFREAEVAVGPIGLGFPTGLHNDEFIFRCVIRTPGFSRTEDWIIKKTTLQLRLRGPLEPIE
jgi:hypothetical protein